MSITEGLDGQPALGPPVKPTPPLLFLGLMSFFARDHGDTLLSEELNHPCQERGFAGRTQILEGVAKTLREHALGLLAYYDYPISTGPLEGTNNKVKTMQRQAYGYRDQEFFRLKIYALHRSKYKLVG